MSPWIPISTLPKSGEDVLLLCVAESGQYICIGYFAKANTIAVPNGDDLGDLGFVYSEEDDEFYLEEGFYEAIRNWGEYSSITINDSVTHWQPLPEVGDAS